MALHLGRAYPGMACGQWVGTARIAGFTDAELPTLGRIMRRESRCNPGAINHRSGDYGLTQINLRTWLARLIHDGVVTGAGELLEPQTNLRAARYIYERAGWSPWRPVP